MKKKKKTKRRREKKTKYLQTQNRQTNKPMGAGAGRGGGGRHPRISQKELRAPPKLRKFCRSRREGIYLYFLLEARLEDRGCKHVSVKLRLEKRETKAATFDSAFST